MKIYIRPLIAGIMAVSMVLPLCACKKKSGKKINLENRIDPELIAGIKVTVGSTVTDVTMKNRIESLKEELLKGGQA